MNIVARGSILHLILEAIERASRHFNRAGWRTMRLPGLSQQKMALALPSERVDEKLHVRCLNYHASAEATQIRHNGAGFVLGHIRQAQEAQRNQTLWIRYAMHIKSKLY